jgi:hypothetical protein
MLNIMKNSEKIEKVFLDYLNSKTKEELNLNESVRAIGDKVSSIIANRIEVIFKKYITEFRVLHNSKKICNVIVKDNSENQYYIDIITHNITKDFVRPNITTVKNIERLYKNSQNIFLILLVHYNPNLNENFFTKVQLFPIEWLSWECLDIGALGNGQIQIKNSNNIVVNYDCSKNIWNKEFKNRLMSFYTKQQEKIHKRISQLMELTLF